MSINDAIKERIRDLPATMSKGQRALESLAIYRAARLPVPDEVLRQIDNCYRHFTEGKPIAFFRATERNIPAPMSLGEAFGVPDLRGGDKIALKRKRLALASPDLVAMFTGQGRAKVPRGRVDFGPEIAAIDRDLTVSAVEEWMERHLSTKTRGRGLSDGSAIARQVAVERPGDAIAAAMASWRRT